MPRDRRGTEPVSARSPLRTRAVLSGIVLPIAIAAAISGGYRASAEGTTVWAVEAAIAALVALIAAIDLAVIARHISRTRHPPG